MTEDSWLDPSPFRSPDDLACFKCGQNGIATVFHSGPHYASSYSGGAGSPCMERIGKGLLNPNLTDHLCRKCRGCGYSWVEKTADDA